MRTRVVVTGMGVISPVGNDVETFWKAQCEGRSGIRPITHFDATAFAARIGGEAQDVVIEGLEPREVRRLDRFSQLAMAASEQAWRQAALSIEQIDPFRAGVVIGSGIGGISTFEEDYTKFLQTGPKRISPFMIPKLLVNIAPGHVAIRFGLKGPNKAVVTACATGLHCVMEGADLIRAGRADVILAGGSEAAVTPLGVGGFGAMRALSTRNDEPTRASRPFDLDRDGFVMSEGAGILVLESEAHARARGAQILGEIAGYGETCDAFHFTAPSPDGVPVARAMQTALADAEVAPTSIDYFNAHGTSTKHNDLTESVALRQVFGEAMPPVSSSKSMIGHLLGAAGSVELIVCLLAIRDGILPPSINYDTPDPECPVNIVANTARHARVEIAMTNSLGFGGHNASLVVRRYE